MNCSIRYVRRALFLLMLVSVGSLNAEHRVLMQGNDRLAIVGVDGEIEWEMKWGGIHDLHVLDNGHIMVQRNMREIVEIDPESKEVVWSYDSSKSNGNEGQKVEVHAFQPLDNGNVMIAESGPARLIEINRDGEIQKQFKLKVNNPHPHTDTRLVRKLSNGHYLACHEADGAVREYDANGKVVWEYEVPLFGKPPKPGHGLEAFGNKCFAAERLESGNTLIATGNGHSVLEVTPEKEIVWQLHQDDLPGIQLAWVTTLEVLPNGNYVIGNCHAGPNNPLLIEVNPATREVVWQFDRFDLFGNSAPNSRILDIDSADASSRLSIGDLAPPVTIADWVKGTKIDSFQQNKVYVVEFWATWCGPCIESMPHMSDLQAKHGERVHFVGITDESRQQVETFLESPDSTGTRGDRIQYTLAIDNNQKTSEDYLLAAGRSGIPCAFIVGKDARIEWVGHPAVIDQPLSDVITDTWDRAAFKKEYELEQLVQRLTEEIQPQIQEAYANQEWDKALDLIARIETHAPADLRLMNMKMTVLRAAGRNAELLTLFSNAVESNWERAERLDVITWAVAAASGEKSDAMLQTALRAAERAAELSEGKNVSVLDTLARVHFEMGDVDKAIETSEQAIAIKKTDYAVKALEAYKAAKAKQEEK